MAKNFATPTALVTWVVSLWKEIIFPVVVLDKIRCFVSLGLYPDYIDIAYN
jgi:hypothetical protein